ncbi:hypothetical protein PBY51_006587 [Eleginops maclovinus]|uniref:Uncharacterized protein n=1 Tax=Eleginops maclovinus TaxID=56733 RepID=A0AAN8AEZ5_ELEMC|nr:hypothetical protein PBY51_006587 [Eleginops maclovinus]
MWTETGKCVSPDMLSTIGRKPETRGKGTAGDGRESWEVESKEAATEGEDKAEMTESSSAREGAIEGIAWEIVNG